MLFNFFTSVRVKVKCIFLASIDAELRGVNIVIPSLEWSRNDDSGHAQNKPSFL